MSERDPRIGDVYRFKDGSIGQRSLLSCTETDMTPKLTLAEAIERHERLADLLPDEREAWAVIRDALKDAESLLREAIDNIEEISDGAVDLCNRIRKFLAEPSQRQEGIYVASRVKHAEMWQNVRARGVHVTSSWIDEAGEGETGDFAELWQRIEREIASSKALVLYARADDFPLKGALIECGMALAHGVPVFVYTDAELQGRTMRPIGSWIIDSRVRVCSSLTEAIDAANGESSRATPPPIVEPSQRQEPINPQFWLNAIRTQAHVTDCQEKTTVLTNAANELERYINRATPPPIEAAKVEAVEGWRTRQTGNVMPAKWNDEIERLHGYEMVAILRREDYGRLITDVEKFKDQVHWTLRRAEQAEAALARVRAERDEAEANAGKAVQMYDAMRAERDALKKRIEDAPTIRVSTSRGSGMEAFNIVVMDVEVEPSVCAIVGRRVALVVVDNNPSRMGDVTP